MSTCFLRRSLLYVPGSSDKMLAKAESVAADAVIIDLEDSVSPDEKDAARQRVAAFIEAKKITGKELIVRINGMDNLWGYLDLLAIAPLMPNAIVLPKADERAVCTCDSFLTALEISCGAAPDSIKLIPLLETAYGIANCGSILQAAKRIDGVQLGAEDLTRDQGIERTVSGKEVLFARYQLAIAGAAAKIDILDTPYTDIHNLDGLREETESAKSMGFTGKTCIHPSHIDTINEIFTPNKEAAADAQALLETYHQSLESGKGACTYNGKMVDAPIAARAEKILNKAKKIGVI